MRAGAAHEKIRVLDFLQKNTMEAERSNASRAQLADLSARVIELRGYL